MRCRERTAVRSGGGTAIARRMAGVAPAAAWWGRGPDGWPLLAVSMGGQRRTQPNALPVHRLSRIWRPRRGEPSPRSSGLSRVGVADLDGDGLADLWGEADGQLRAFRGEAPEALAGTRLVWRGPRALSRGHRRSFNRPPIWMATESPIR